MLSFRGAIFLLQVRSQSLQQITFRNVIEEPDFRKMPEVFANTSIGSEPLRATTNSANVDSIGRAKGGLHHFWIVEGHLNST